MGGRPVKITTNRDPARGTLQVVMDMPLGADPERMADLAWSAVERGLIAAQRAAGTVPAGLRTPITE